jgi:multiple sugar transport system permease protein
MQRIRNGRLGRVQGPDPWTRLLGTLPPVRPRTLWRHLPAALLAALFLAPLVFMVSGSLRQAGQPPPRTPELIPDPLAFGNYERAFELVDLPHYALNSLFVCAVAVPLTVLFASWTGFAMARLPRRWSTLLVVLSLVALMVPATALLVPRFVLFRWLGLIDTYVPLIAPVLIGTSPFYVLLFYWAFRSLPAELFEASRLAGLTPFQTWRGVAMPLVRPVSIAVAVLAFVFTWSNFLDPLIYLFDEDRYTLPLGLRVLSEVDPTNFPLFLAGAVSATVPVVVAFLYVQRFFLQEYRAAGWLGR